MDCECYLRKGIVYIPTLGTISRGFCRTIEPVAVVSVSDSDLLYRAFSAAIARGNPKVTLLAGEDDLPPILPKYAGVKSWKAFVRDSSTWEIRERNGIFSIFAYRRDPPNGWAEDHENIETFPRGTSVDQVIQRIIAILQEASGTKEPQK